MTDTANQTTETKHEFQAEVARLLELMVHSVYSEREVFLRELVSNSADALDKLRYEALTDESLMESDEELAITLEVDKTAKTLTLIDNGIGMSHDELVENLGTIARSGTKAFIDEIKKGDDKPASGPDLIGQFGVGFYAAFMVAKRVDVISRRAGSDKTFLWSSDGKGAFEISKQEEASPRGTRITLHIKDDATEFLEEDKIRHIVHTYSDHISFPIFLKGEKAEPIEGEEDDTPEADQQLNAANALWTRPKSEISAEQYKEFYHHTGGMFDDPALTIHYSAEGRQLFTALLFVPSMAPFDLYDQQRDSHIKLFVKRIFITDDAKILPSYLRFARGVVDSEDIPLNLSREMLQNNPLLTSIRKAVTNKLLSELKKCANKQPDDYRKIWESFGPVMKEGLYEDPERRDTLYELVRFKTTKTEMASKVETDEDDKANPWRSLKDYVADMPEEQNAIYYLAGHNLDQLKASPQLEGYLARNIEVLLMADPVDSFWVSTAAGYEGKALQSITQGDADLEEIKTNDEDKPNEDTSSDALIDKLKEALKDEVMDIKKSTRLVSSPACLVASAQAPDLQLEKMLSMQKGGSGLPSMKPILEINASHALAKALNTAITDNKDQRFDDLAFLLLDEARILEGNAPADPAKFTERLNRLLLDS
ncbi:MAG: molecular chaperone HtpG [Hyphomicrobiaceae bacterium]|nr:molecular chaperone HtpG [Hyphomicrobiaceae bacterium]